MEVRIYTVQFTVELDDDADRAEFERDLNTFLDGEAVDDIVIDSMPAPQT